MAREALTVIGYVAGSYFGPVGAAIGATIGGYIGGIVDPQQIPGPGLSEAPVQTSRDGVPIPIVWGTHVCHGNIIQKGTPYEVTTTESAGKGAETTSTRRYMTFAIGVCEGPASISRIWENDKLVYDARTAGVLAAVDHEDFAGKITIYSGDESQLPDSDLETITGVGEQPAYRGLCYVVFPDYDITDYGSAIPQYKFEVNGSTDKTVISKPYPIELLDGAVVTYAPEDDAPNTSYIEGNDPTFTPQDSTLRALLNNVDYEDEGADVTFAPQNSEIRAAVKSADYEDEGADVTFAPQDSTLRDALVAYVYEDEGADATFTPQDGTLI